MKKLYTKFSRLFNRPKVLSLLGVASFVSLVLMFFLQYLGFLSPSAYPVM